MPPSHMPYSLPPVGFFKVGAGADLIGAETIKAIDGENQKSQPGVAAEIKDADPGKRAASYFKMAISGITKSNKEGIAKQLTTAGKKTKARVVLNNRVHQLNQALKQRGEGIPTQQEFRNVLDALSSFRDKMNQSQVVVDRGGDLSVLTNVWKGWNRQLNSVAGKSLFPDGGSVAVKMRSTPGRQLRTEVKGAGEKLTTDKISLPIRNPGAEPDDLVAVTEAGAAVRKSRVGMPPTGEPPTHVASPNQTKPVKGR